MQNKKTGKGKTIKRLLKYVTKGYKFQLVVVLVSIIISALVGVLGVQFIKYLIVPLKILSNNKVPTLQIKLLLVKYLYKIKLRIIYYIINI